MKTKILITIVSIVMSPGFIACLEDDDDDNPKDYNPIELTEINANRAFTHDDDPRNNIFSPEERERETLLFYGKDNNKRYNLYENSTSKDPYETGKNVLYAQSGIIAFQKEGTSTWVEWRNVKLYENSYGEKNSPMKMNRDAPII